jgi:small subunit ribosomal protein S23
MRKLATQVPASVSRLLQSSLLQSPPAWYTPVLANPPSVLPPRQTVPRQRKLPGGVSDLPPQHLDRSKEGLTRTHKMKHLRETKPRPQEIVYPEDRVRRQFFKDFPFEALRPTSLVEGQDLRDEGATGREWISLAQRGAYPTVERCVVLEPGRACQVLRTGC